MVTSANFETFTDLRTYKPWQKGDQVVITRWLSLKFLGYLRPTVLYCASQMEDLLVDVE